MTSSRRATRIRIVFAAGLASLAFALCVLLFPRGDGPRESAPAGAVRAVDAGNAPPPGEPLSASSAPTASWPRSSLDEEVPAKPFVFETPGIAPAPAPLLRVRCLDPRRRPVGGARLVFRDASKAVVAEAVAADDGVATLDREPTRATVVQARCGELVSNEVPLSRESSTGVLEVHL